MKGIIYNYKKAYILAKTLFIWTKILKFSLTNHFYYFQQAVGISLETRRIDIFERAILESVCIVFY